MGGQLVTYLNHHLHRLGQKLQDEPFDPFAGATELLQSPPRADPSAPLYPRKIPPLPDYNTLFTERIAIADTDPNQRGTSTCTLLVGVIPCVSKVEPSVPELLPEDQIRVSATLKRTFPELSDKVNENELSKLEFTIPNFDEIRNTLNDGEIPTALEFFSGGPSLKFEQIINNLGINQDSRDFFLIFCRMIYVKL